MNPITLFVAGDVMTGRGIDQILSHPNDPVLYESYVKNSVTYVKLAEKAHGPIPQPAGFSYIWGAALGELKKRKPDKRIINLETSITTNEYYWPHKGINYRMHPKNIECISAADIDFCALANNHVLDWGYGGLKETINTLKQARIRYAGAGMNLKEAREPAIMEIPGKGRVLMFSLGFHSSGIPADWAAREDKPGVCLVTNVSRDIDYLKKTISALKRPGDLVVASIHWGGNWGYDVPPGQIEFAHRLIDEAETDIIHGHSSHHAKGIEVYKQKPVIYGAGDLLNDYEGIKGYENYRDDLVLMYFITMDPGTGKLESLEMVPLQIRKFTLNQVSKKDAAWLEDVLNREGEQFNTSVEVLPDNSSALRWD